ncbi:cation:dicarboxylase symporter family transporter, partial [Staphylococcus aureus]|nr:cation:dicarboxylase symporter family transporter [Staphylococcus aureus]
LKSAIDAIYSLVMASVTFVLRLTPYGVLAIMANTLSTSDFGASWTLGQFLIASYAAIITMYLIHIDILSLLGISPI